MQTRWDLNTLLLFLVFGLGIFRGEGTRAQEAVCPVRVEVAVDLDQAPDETASTNVYVKQNVLSKLEQDLGYADRKDAEIILILNLKKDSDRDGKSNRAPRVAHAYLANFEDHRYLLARKKLKVLSWHRLSNTKNSALSDVRSLVSSLPPCKEAMKKYLEKLGAGTLVKGGKPVPSAPVRIHFQGADAVHELFARVASARSDDAFSWTTPSRLLELTCSLDSRSVSECTFTLNLRQAEKDYTVTTESMQVSRGVQVPSYRITVFDPADVALFKSALNGETDLYWPIQAPRLTQTFFRLNCRANYCEIILRQP